MILRFSFMLFIIFCLVVVISTQTHSNNTGYSVMREKRILDSLFESGFYDKRTRPRGENGPTDVRINLYVRNIDKIDDMRMEMAIEINLRQMWKDTRLVYDDDDGRINYITLQDPDKIWTPDLFFTNEKLAQAHKVVKPNILIRIQPNGEILYSTRLSLTLSCDMDFRNYPLDTQTCTVVLASYSFTIEDIVLLWKKDNPVVLGSQIYLQSFTLYRFTTDYCTSSTSTGEYACLKLELNLSRNFKYYQIHVYIPSLMLIIISWLSFWVDSKAVTARFMVIITTLFTLAMHTNWIYTSVPTTSYTKALDVWTGVCMTFVFGSLLEFIVIHYISRSDERKNDVSLFRYDVAQTSALEADRIHDSPESIAMNPIGEEANSPSKSSLKDHKKKCPKAFERFLSILPCRRWCSQQNPRLSEKIDFLSKICFPLAFIVFNICYWATFL